MGLEGESYWCIGHGSRRGDLLVYWPWVLKGDLLVYHPWVLKGSLTGISAMGPEGETYWCMDHGF